MSDRTERAKEILYKIEECLVLSDDFEDDHGTNNCLRMTKLIVNEYILRLDDGSVDVQE